MFIHPFLLPLLPPPKNESLQHSRTNKRKQVLAFVLLFVHLFSFHFKINNFIYKGQSKRDALEGNNPFSCPK